MRASAGIGFKPIHFEEATACRAEGLWLEVHAENYMVGGGPRLAMLEALRSEHALSLHGVAMSLAGHEPLDVHHLARLKALVDRFDPFLVSEHLAWSRSGGVHLADLLPVPRSNEALRVVAALPALTNPVLAYYGGGFAAFLARAPMLAHSLYVVDCARIDRAFLEAHLAEDAGDAPLSASEIAAEQWRSVIALLHPATRFRWFSNTTPTLWQSLRAVETRRTTPDTPSEGILITRPSGSVEAVPIQRAQYDLLASLVEGETVGAAASKAARRYSETTIADAFASLLTRGAVYGFKLKEGGRVFEGD